jgi:hypothetical protein
MSARGQKFGCALIGGWMVGMGMLGCGTAQSEVSGAAPLPVSIYFHNAERMPVLGGAVQLAQEVWESDASGIVELQIPPSKLYQRIRAQCPHTHWSNIQERVLTPLILQSQKKLAIDVLCQPRHKYFAVAVHSECERVEIEANGMPLGVTNKGVLYAEYGQLTERGAGADTSTVLQLTGRSLDQNCLLLGPGKKLGSEQVQLALNIEKDTQAVWTSLSRAAPKRTRQPRRQKARPLRL